MNQTPLLSSPRPSASLRSFARSHAGQADVVRSGAVGSLRSQAAFTVTAASAVKGAATEAMYSSPMNRLDATNALVVDTAFVDTAFAADMSVTTDICTPTTKRTWTKTPVTLFGTHRQRPKEFAL